MTDTSRTPTRRKRNSGTNSTVTTVKSQRLVPADTGAVQAVRATHIGQRFFANECAAMGPVTPQQLDLAHKLLTNQDSVHARVLLKVLSNAGMFQVAP